VRDPSLLPEIRPDHLAINSLLAPAMEEVVAAIEAPPILPSDAAGAPYDGPERRSGADRRTLQSVHFPERRSFGRRATDLPVFGSK
jgi:hypothetical protein